MKATNKFIKLSGLSLRKDNYSNENYPVILTWCIRKGYPRAMVWFGNNFTVKHDNNTNNNNTNINKTIIAPMDHITLGLIINLYKELDKQNIPANFKVDHFNVKYIDDVQSNETYVQATTEIGIDQNGIYYISIFSKDKPKVIFELLPKKKWFNFYLSGLKIDKESDISRLYARSYFDKLETLMTQEMSNDISSIIRLDHNDKSINENNNTTNDNNDTNTLINESLLISEH